MGLSEPGRQVPHGKRCKVAEMEKNEAFLMAYENWPAILAMKAKMAGNCRRCALTLGWVSKSFDPMSRACDRFNLPNSSHGNVLAVLMPLCHIIKGFVADNNLCRFCCSRLGQLDLHQLRFKVELALPVTMEVCLSILGMFIL